MKKIILTSHGLPSSAYEPFEALVGKPLHETTFAYSGNAKDCYPAIQRTHRTRSELVAAGIHVENFDLRHYYDEPKKLEALLESFDGVWFGGGNTYYLRYAMRRAGFDSIIQGLLDRGLVFGGTSAGAITAGPTLKHYELADEPGAAPILIYEGLSLVDFAALPHWNQIGWKRRLEKIRTNLEGDNFATLTLHDNQVAFIEDKKVAIFPSDE